MFSCFSNARCSQQEQRRKSERYLSKLRKLVRNRLKKIKKKDEYETRTSNLLQR